MYVMLCQRQRRAVVKREGSGAKTGSDPGSVTPPLKLCVPQLPSFKMRYHLHQLEYLAESVQFSHSVVSNSLLPQDCSVPDSPVHHQLLELAQTHVHRVSEAIQPFHPLSSSYFGWISMSKNSSTLNEMEFCFSLVEGCRIVKWVSCSVGLGSCLLFSSSQTVVSIPWTMMTAQSHTMMSTP